MATDFTDLQFAAQKQDIINFLSGRTEFKDFNFTGSAASILLDGLTFCTINMAQYANLSLNECFMDSAQLRSTVVSHGKSLNYIPRGYSSAQATLNISINLGSQNSGFTDFYIPAYTKFAAQVGNQSFSFLTLEQYQLLDSVTNPGVYTAQILINEGLQIKQQFTYNPAIPNQRFVLSNQNVDTTQVQVTTKPNTTSTSITQWEMVDNIVTVDNQTKAFFVQEGVDGFWEVFFGDGIIGAVPNTGDIVTITYLVTQGQNANGINTFAMIDNIYRQPANQAPITYPGNTFAISVVNPSQYGGNREDINSIRTLGPINWKAQNRTVVIDDYTAILQKNYGFIQTMSVWGGQDSVPPEYGKVLIAIKPTYGNFLSPLTKQNMVSFLQDNYAILGITPKIVDPDFTYVYVTSNVIFEKNLTTLTDGQLIAAVQQTISNFFQNNVAFFNGQFRFSKFAAAIDNTDQSIIGNNTSLQLGKIIQPTIGIPTQYTMSVYNQVLPNTVSTIAFISTSGQTNQIKDDGNGNLDLYANGVLVSHKIGTVDYSSGTITLNSFVFNVPVGTSITFLATPVNSDVFSVRNSLIVLQSSQVTATRTGTPTS